MKTADVIINFFSSHDTTDHTSYCYLIKLKKYWCVNIFFIGLKPHFLAFLPVIRKKLNFYKNYPKTVIFSGILNGCIDESIIKVNVGGFNM